MYMYITLSYMYNVHVHVQCMCTHVSIYTLSWWGQTNHRSLDSSCFELVSSQQLGIHITCLADTLPGFTYMYNMVLLCIHLHTKYAYTCITCTSWISPCLRRSKVNDLCFSRQVRRLLSSSDQGSVGIWDLDIEREEVSVTVTTNIFPNSKSQL